VSALTAAVPSNATLERLQRSEPTISLDVSVSLASASSQTVPAKAAPKGLKRKEPGDLEPVSASLASASALPAVSSEAAKSVVRVLQVPVRINCAAASIPCSGAGHVCVMGMHKSGTHALTQYLRQYFDVAVLPTTKDDKNEGVVVLGDFAVWKHTVPLTPLRFPSSMGTSLVTVLLTVRDPVSWMASLSREPFEIFPVSGKRRKKLSLSWMFESCELRTSANFHRDWFPNARFKSVLDLWATYVHGYLTALVTPDGDSSRVFVVRYEDIVRRPGEMVEELATLGLPRNGRTFVPIEGSVTNTHETRKDICAREDGISISSNDRERIAMDLLRHASLLDYLCYTAPSTKQTCTSSTSSHRTV